MDAYWKHYVPVTGLPHLVGVLRRRYRKFAARASGLAFGLALAVRPAGLAEVSRVNGAPQARPRAARM
jgi:hypothetical protein